MEIRFRTTFSPALSFAERATLTALLSRTESALDERIAVHFSPEELHTPSPEVLQRIAVLRHDYLHTHPDWWTAFAFYRSFDAIVSSSLFVEAGDAFFDSIVPRDLASMTQERLTALQMALCEEYTTMHRSPPLRASDHLAYAAHAVAADLAAVISGTTATHQPIEEVYRANLTAAYQQTRDRFQRPTVGQLDLMLTEWSRFYENYVLMRGRGAPYPAGAGTPR